MVRSKATAVVAALASAAFLSLLSPAGAAAGASPQPGGVVLDGWGGLHPFGGFQLDSAGAPQWPGWDIARAVVVRGDGAGGWTLDGWGGIHAFGAAAAVATPAYQPGLDTARDFVVTSTDSAGQPDGRAGYLLESSGAIHGWGGVPPLTGPTWPGKDIAEGLAVHYTPTGLPDGAWELLMDGTIVTVGAAPAVALADQHVAAVWRHLHANLDGTLWALAGWGVTRAVTSSPVASSWSGYPDWGSWNIVRDLVLGPGNSGHASQPVSQSAGAAFRNAYRPSGGVTLDGWGGLHSWGGLSLDGAGAPYWPGWDIARSAVVREDGSGGWVLDGWGGIHAFGDAAAIAAPSYWPRWDIARALVVTSHDAHGDLGAALGESSPAIQGYVLDGFGGVHPFGGAPALPQSAYWGGWDVAAGIDVHLDGSGAPDGLAVLDDFGGLHYAGGYPNVANPPPYNGMHYIYQRLGRSDDGHLYAVTRFGKMFDLGTQDESGSPSQATSKMAPYWGGYGDWARWDILRDIDVGRGDNPSPSAQPISPDALDEYQNWITDLHSNSLNAPSVRQDKPLDCESAATSAALLTLGAGGASQDWVFSQLPVDTRGAWMQGGRPTRWGDPWTSFVGNVDGSESQFTGYGVYYAPLITVANAAGRGGFGAQGWSLTDLYAEIDRGHPVVLFINNSYQHVNPSYWTAWDGALVPYTLGDHAVLLYGVDFGTGTVSIMDDYTGTFRTFSMGQFGSFMSTYDDMAAVFE
jgi:uncharacterized protein YvpB